jgi:hypothetical protein
VTDLPPERRPRPQYGEYATPEEQRARIRQPAPPSAPDAGRTPVASTPPAPRVSPADATVAVSPTAARPRYVDRVVTFALLAYGLVTVIGSIPAAADYTQFAATFFEALGVDQTLSDPAGARGWGLASALVLGIGWLLTLAVSWRSVRAGRLSFWIPLVGGVVFNAISSLLLVVPLAADPALWSALQDAITSRMG